MRRRAHVVTYGSCRHKYPFPALLRTAPRRSEDEGSASAAVLVASHRLAQAAVSCYSFQRDIVVAVVTTKVATKGAMQFDGIGGKTTTAKKKTKKPPLHGPPPRGQ